MATSEEIVRNIAAKLESLDSDGNLMEMDSLTVPDFVTELEEKTGKTVPTTQIRRSNFESVQAIVGLLERL